MKFKSRLFFVILALTFLSIGGFANFSTPAYGQNPSVTYLNIGLGYSTYDTNTMPFASYSVITDGNYQFVAYYNTLPACNHCPPPIGHDYVEHNRYRFYR